MKIIGIGTDIVEISRIIRVLERQPGFLKRILTEEEIAYCTAPKLRPASVAARFAAKEAVAKALGTGFREFRFRDIEIGRSSQGAPLVILQGKALQYMEGLGGRQIHLSISHAREYATAVAVLTGE